MDMNRVFAAIAVLSGFGAIAGSQCVVPLGAPASSVESPGGSSCGLPTPCSSYQSCPGSDACVSASCGYISCGTAVTINAACQAYTGGTCNTTSYTCSGGTYAGPSGVMVSITVYNIGTTKHCGDCWPDDPEGGDN